MVPKPALRLPLRLADWKARFSAVGMLEALNRRNKEKTAITRRYCLAQPTRYMNIAESKIAPWKNNRLRCDRSYNLPRIGATSRPSKPLIVAMVPICIPLIPMS